MLCALDVHYYTDQGADRATAAAVVFETWSSAEAIATYSTTIEAVQPYEPGQFYKRELPCLLAVIEAIANPITVYLVDGYVWLGATTPGLGHHLYHALKPHVPVVGIAKAPFKDLSGSTPVLRGSSQNPLYVSTIDMFLEEALQGVQKMHGEHRIPTLLKQVDQLSRQLNKPG